ncbi:MAG: hypothetical protein LCH39_00160 [Proteobacteria bacterium]|nr:hypothetical protein [Pseudomonadota bacterium]
MIGSLATLAGLELRDVARRNLRAVGLLAGAAVFGIGGAAYGLSALGRHLSMLYGPMEADILIGAGLLIVALLLAFAAWLVRRQPKSRQTRTAMALAAAPVALSLGRRLAPSLIKVAPLMLIAGVLAGRSFASKE